MILAVMKSNRFMGGEIMKRMLLLCVCSCIAMLMLSGVAYAADDYWYGWHWDCRADAGDMASHTLRCGVNTAAQDGYDDGGESILNDGPSAVHAGVYHSSDDGGWPNGFYQEDIRSPIPLVPGASKSWLINVWADPSLDSSISTMTFIALSGGMPPPTSYHYTLTLLKKPAGIVDGPAEGTSYDMSYHTLEWIAGFELPTYRTEDGRDGYLIELRATTTPESSSLLALAGGLASIGGLAIRRRVR